MAHLYNLRRAAGYQRAGGAVPATRSTANAIGERRAPDPQGRPGFIRIDSVHQGDLDGLKGFYSINSVDTLNQSQVIAAVEWISENYMLQVLHTLLTRFPFQLRGFHADNGSEYINHRVAKLLTKLNIELTTSRPRHSNDSVLAETKNGAIVREHLGYTHIPSRFAELVNQFTLDVLTPYVNFHRPCFLPHTTLDAKGRQRKLYRCEDMMTPFDKLASQPNLSEHLKPGIRLSDLQRQAGAQSDSAAARHLNTCRTALFDQILRPRKPA